MKKSLKTKTQRSPKKKEINILLGQAVAMTIAGVAAGMIFQYLLTKPKTNSKNAEEKTKKK